MIQYNMRFTRITWKLGNIDKRSPQAKGKKEARTRTPLATWSSMRQRSLRGDVGMQVRNVKGNTVDINQSSICSDAQELEDIKSASVPFRKLNLSYISRSLNIRADSLAKRGRSRALHSMIVNVTVQQGLATAAGPNEPELVALLSRGNGIGNGCLCIVGLKYVFYVPAVSKGGVGSGFSFIPFISGP
ncbi:hypothetical protein YC2023_123867 [Brassica napus]